MKLKLACLLLMLVVITACSNAINAVTPSINKPDINISATPAVVSGVDSPKHSLELPKSYSETADVIVPNAIKFLGMNKGQLLPEILKTTHGDILLLASNTKGNSLGDYEVYPNGYIVREPDTQLMGNYKTGTKINKSGFYSRLVEDGYIEPTNFKDKGWLTGITTSKGLITINAFNGTVDLNEKSIDTLENFCSKDTCYLEYDENIKKVFSSFGDGGTSVTTLSDGSLTHIYFHYYRNIGVYVMEYEEAHPNQTILLHGWIDSVQGDTINLRLFKSYSDLANKGSKAIEKATLTLNENHQSATLEVPTWKYSKIKLSVENG